MDRMAKSGGTLTWSFKLTGERCAHAERQPGSEDSGSAQGDAGAPSSDRSGWARDSVAQITASAGKLTARRNRQRRAGFSAFADEPLARASYGPASAFAGWGEK